MKRKEKNAKVVKKNDFLIKESHFIYLCARLI